MCFVSDCDWYPNLVHLDTITADAVRRCDECRRDVQAGGTLHHVYMQEAEECKACEHGNCECVGDCCQCAEPSTGESFDWVCCEDCHKFLESVKATEVAAGCHVNEATPSLCGMLEEIFNGGREEAGKYFRTAIRMFPELQRSGFLGWLWREIFQGDS